MCTFSLVVGRRGLGAGAPWRQQSPWQPRQLRAACGGSREQKSSMVSQEAGGMHCTGRARVEIVAAVSQGIRHPRPRDAWLGMHSTVPRGLRIEREEHAMTGNPIEKKILKPKIRLALPCKPQRSRGVERRRHVSPRRTDAPTKGRRVHPAN